MSDRLWPDCVIGRLTEGRQELAFRAYREPFWPLQTLQGR